MTDNVEHLILEHLKAIRTDQQIMKTDLRDIKMRLLTLEAYRAAQHTDSARQSARLDDFEQRLERVERRLELRDEA